MAISVTHSFSSPVTDAGDPDLVGPDEWNDEHVVSISAADISAAPSDAGYLVTAASSGLSAEVAVGATPGGELGGTWAAPTVDTTHAGSSHAGVVSTHEAASDPHPGYVQETLIDAAGDLLVGSAADTAARLAKGTAGEFLQAGASTLAYAKVFIPITWKVDGTLPASRAGTSPWRNRTGRTLTFARVELDCTTAPTGQSILVDLNAGSTFAGATTVFSTQGNRPAVAASAFNGSTTTFNTGTLSDGDLIFPDLDQAGSGTTGANLMITVWMWG